MIHKIVRCTRDNIFKNIGKEDGGSLRTGSACNGLKKENCRLEDGHGSRQRCYTGIRTDGEEGLFEVEITGVLIGPQ